MDAHFGFARALRRFPRTRGDRPAATPALALAIPPHARGCPGIAYVGAESTQQRPSWHSRTFRNNRPKDTLASRERRPDPVTQHLTEYAMSSEPNSAEAKSQLITRFKQRDYEVLLIREPDHPGYSVLCPELGCASQGDDREETLEMIAEAISLFLDSYINEGQEPPLKPGAMAETVAEYDTEGFHQTDQATVRPLDWDEIITGCDKALAHNAEDVSALIKRGGAFLNKNDHRWAMADYDSAIAIAPENAEAYRGRADAHFNQRNFESAIADYDAALRRDPYDEIAVAALESTYIALWKQRQSA